VYNDAVCVNAALEINVLDYNVAEATYSAVLSVNGVLFSLVNSIVTLATALTLMPALTPVRITVLRAVASSWKPRSLAIAWMDKAARRPARWGRWSFAVLHLSLTVPTLPLSPCCVCI